MAFGPSFLASPLGLELDICTPGEAQATLLSGTLVGAQALPTARPGAHGACDPAWGNQSHVLSSTGCERPLPQRASLFSDITGTTPSLY